MTISEIMNMIGKELGGMHCTVRCGTMLVCCKVVDARQVWNRIDVKVVPVSGDGHDWVSWDSIRSVNSQLKREWEDANDYATYMAFGRKGRG